MAPNHEEEMRRTQRLQFLETENQQLTERNTTLKEERRKHEEKQWAMMHAKIDGIRSDVHHCRNEVAGNTQICAAVQADVADMKRRHETIVTVIKGPDEDPERGIAFRLKTVEKKQEDHEKQHDENRKWWLGIGAAAFIGLGKTIWDMIAKKG